MLADQRCPRIFLAQSLEGFVEDLEIRAAVDRITIILETPARNIDLARSGPAFSYS
jgi:hypothetical protein